MRENEKRRCCLLSSVYSGNASKLMEYVEYDNYASFWNKYWGRTSARRVLPIIRKLLLDKHVPKGSSIVDICCGSGQLLKLLSKEGYIVSGIDGSSEMIRFATGNCPAGEFIVGDIRVPYTFRNKFRAAFSFYDSLNHVLKLEELVKVFENIYASLDSEGTLVFDLNMEEGYKQRWNNKDFHVVHKDYVCIDRFKFNEFTGIGQNNVTLFTLQDGWKRRDVTIVEKCYSLNEVISALSKAGFINVEIYESSSDFQLHDDMGRYYFVCKTC
jgi:SAM-dependent methyltransferase